MGCELYKCCKACFVLLTLYLQLSSACELISEQNSQIIEQNKELSEQNKKLIEHSKRLSAQIADLQESVAKMDNHRF